LKNYKAEELVYYEPKSAGFKLENFAPFIHGNNILEIQQELEESIFHVERNANPKILFTDLSIKLTRLIHRKAA
jgi:DNA polymerase-3 subunit delta'